MGGKQKVANFSIGIESHYKDDDGHKRGHTEWVDLVAWGTMATVAEKFLRKGAKIFASGRIETTRWIDKPTGQKRRKTRVIVACLIFLEGARGRKKRHTEEVAEETSDESDESPF